MSDVDRECPSSVAGEALREAVDSFGVRAASTMDDVLEVESSVHYTCSAPSLLKYKEYNMTSLGSRNIQLIENNNI